MQQKLQEGDKFPVIRAQSVDGSAFNLTNYTGKKIFYSFFRYTGCLACSLYFHQIQTKRKEFEAKNIVLVGLYEVNLEMLKTVLPGQTANYWGAFLADPTGKYYDQCGLERSSAKLYASFTKVQTYRALLEKKENVLTVPNSKNTRDGSGKRNRMPAQFLVDAKGKVLAAYYGKNVSDRMPLSKII